MADYGLLSEAFASHIDFDLLQGANKLMLQQINAEEGAVGVHVRRGDMAQTGYYWEVLTPDYFVKAMSLLQQQVSKAHFFFFSDDMPWVISEILPRLDPSISFTIVDINASDCAYCDLLLLTACKHQIASQGSMGKYAGAMNSYVHKIVVLPDMVEVESEGASSKH